MISTAVGIAGPDAEQPVGNLVVGKPCKGAIDHDDPVRFRDLPREPGRRGEDSIAADFDVPAVLDEHAELVATQSATDIGAGDHVVSDRDVGGFLDQNRRVTLRRVRGPKFETLDRNTGCAEDVQRSLDLQRIIRGRRRIASQNGTGLADDRDWRIDDDTAGFGVGAGLEDHGPVGAGGVNRSGQSVDRARGYGHRCRERRGG